MGNVEEGCGKRGKEYRKKVEEMGKEEGGEWMVMGGKREEEMGWVER